MTEDKVPITSMHGNANVYKTAYQLQLPYHKLT